MIIIIKLFFKIHGKKFHLKQIRNFFKKSIFKIKILYGIEFKNKNVKKYNKKVCCYSQNVVE